MKYIFAIFLLRICGAQSDECGGLCECSDSIVTCRYLLSFPILIGRSAVTDMTLVFSDIVAVPNLGVEYPRLQTLSFRQCRHVTCALIQRIKREKPGILVDHDENCTPSTTSTTTITATSTSTTTTAMSTIISRRTTTGSTPSQSLNTTKEVDTGAPILTATSTGVVVRII